MTSAGLIAWDARRALRTVVRAGPLAWFAGLAALIGAAGLLRALTPPEIQGAGAAARWGFVVAAPVAFFAYGVLLRPGDAWLLRHFGIPAGAILGRQAFRLGSLAAATVFAALVLFLDRQGWERSLALTVAAGAAAAGSVLFAYARAAQAVGGGTGRRGLLGRMIAWDRELAAAAPLVYAPVVPLIAGVVAAAWVGSRPGAEWGRVLIAGLIACGAGISATGAYTRTLSRWMPVLAEMAFAPPPPVGAGALVTDRGVARLLPRSVAALWARDAAVVARRFRWAARLSWPVAGVGVLALARAADNAAVRGWVAVFALLAVAAQLGAVIALGRHEHGARRWLDRSLGVTWAQRLLGRWMLGVGLTTWLVLPLAIAWGLAVPGASGWPWVLAAVGAAAGAALGSIALAG